MKQQSEYLQLATDVRNYYENKNIKGGYYTRKDSQSKKIYKEDFFLKWCPECEEINLWTYWQGKNNLQAEILLLGQDWASAWEPDSKGKLKEYVSRILNGKNGFSERYISEIMNDSSPTDKTLRKMMSRLGEEYDPFIPDNDKLFFTNLCLGYRDRGASGGMDKKAIKHDVPYIERLIAIVNPKIIICLGKDTYDSFVAGAKCKQEVKEKSFYKKLTQGKCYAWYQNKIPVFGQAHTGTLGAMNRWRYNTEKIEYHDGICEELLAHDWDIMKSFLK